jgi:hypothetical protein
MKKDITWKDIADDFANNVTPFDMNEKVFARMKGTSWPLWGPYEEEMDSSSSEFDIDNVACVTNMVLEMFSDWQSDTDNVDIQMKYVAGNWDVGVGLDAESSLRLSHGGKPSASFKQASGDSPSLTILRAAVDLQCDLEDARPAPSETPEP